MRLVQENEEAGGHFKLAQVEMQRIKQSLMENIVVFKGSVRTSITNMKREAFDYYSLLEPIFGDENDENQ